MAWTKRGKCIESVAIRIKGKASIQSIINYLEKQGYTKKKIKSIIDEAIILFEKIENDKLEVQKEIKTFTEAVWLSKIAEVEEKIKKAKEESSVLLGN